MNHLAHEKSPYLLQHKTNPVDWYPWGAEAFEKARKENKPIFLSIGYSTCHWCHVMAHESFENPDIAKILNDSFVSIKVDREERPDVDRVYMAFVQATTGSGGWPMSVWLTPDGKPFLGGTYFPPEDRYGRAGFKSVLHRIAGTWKEDQKGILDQGTHVLAALRESLEKSSDETFKKSADPLNTAFAQLAGNFDQKNGGFGGSPKFPRPVVLNFLFRYYADQKGKHSDEALQMALTTLKKMAAGGMHDHLGGGFHRYSVDAIWHVPHFEKMLYDQAQLASSYLDAFQITHDPQYAETARSIFSYVLRDMTHADGGFYSAEDADSAISAENHEHAEGAFYVWDEKEIQSLLKPETAGVFNYIYGVKPHGNVMPDSDPHGEFTGKNILIQRHSIAEAGKALKMSEEEVTRALAQSKETLFSVRDKRPRPHRDDKILTAWNGLMISAFAKAYRILGDEQYRDTALKAADFVLKNLRDKNGHLLRTWRDSPGTIGGFAEDYAFFIQASLDLYEATFDPRWMDLAFSLQEQQDALFLDTKDGTYFSNTANDPFVILRMKEDYDGAEPSANSISAMNLLRLGRILHRDTLEEHAQKILAAATPLLTSGPTAIPQMLCALDFALHAPEQAVIVGDRSAQDTQQMLKTVQADYLPNLVVLLKNTAKPQEGILTKELEPFTSTEGKPTFYLCENFTCQAPTTEIKEVTAALKKRKQ